MRNDRQVYFAGSFTSAQAGKQSRPASVKKAQQGFNVIRVMCWAFGLAFVALSVVKYVA